MAADAEAGPRTRAARASCCGLVPPNEFVVSFGHVLPHQVLGSLCQVPPHQVLVSLCQVLPQVPQVQSRKTTRFSCRVGIK